MVPNRERVVGKMLTDLMDANEDEDIRMLAGGVNAISTVDRKLELLIQIQILKTLKQIATRAT